MNKTLDELMTDEAEQGYNTISRNRFRAELREPLRALRESHDRLLEAVKLAEDLMMRMGYDATADADTRGGRALAAFQAAIEAATGRPR